MRCERVYEQGLLRLCLEVGSGSEYVAVFFSNTVVFIAFLSLTSSHLKEGDFFFFGSWFEDEVHLCREGLLTGGSGLGECGGALLDQETEDRV